MKWNRRFRGLTLFVFNFGVGSLEQTGSARNFRFPWQFPSLNTSFSKPITKKQCVLQCFRCLSYFSAAVGKENLHKTPAIVSLKNFQILLRHPRLAFDWLSVSFFDHWPIRMSDLLLTLHWINPFCTELTLFCTELPENCIYLHQSELSNFFMYIFIVQIWVWVVPAFIELCFSSSLDFPIINDKIF